ncbi:GNAT family N-acetyltransferase [Paenibacillus sp. CAA11]|uniref:GNAT family N-acetyltransferase n=1 Tax=Paenibacillus sp. CAA11 TaxID=1532905 RepID=UPI000D3B515E|nr:GNAT family N-acetyltransferase [Paenibacillus sp. CAA11]AWB46514.1 GNAT family N-acetyltransferase [Paenibacillus sp. CAA11]
MESLKIEQIPWGTPAYEAGLQLRDAVLRRPLGLAIEDDDLQGEARDIHIRAIGASQATLGVLLLRRVDEYTLQMKQVAVAEFSRGQGVGKQLVRFSEELGAARGYHSIMLHAREAAVPFYSKLGYEPEGEMFMEVGIRHQRMLKRLV